MSKYFYTKQITKNSANNETFQVFSNPANSWSPFTGFQLLGIKIAQKPTSGSYTNTYTMGYGTGATPYTAVSSIDNKALFDTAMPGISCKADGKYIANTSSVTMTTVHTVTLTGTDSYDVPMIYLDPFPSALNTSFLVRVTDGQTGGLIQVTLVLKEI